MYTKCTKNFLILGAYSLRKGGGLESIGDIKRWQFLYYAIYNTKDMNIKELFDIVEVAQQGEEKNRWEEDMSCMKLLISLHYYSMFTPEYSLCRREVINTHHPGTVLLVYHPALLYLPVLQFVLLSVK